MKLIENSHFIAWLEFGLDVKISQIEKALQLIHSEIQLEELEVDEVTLWEYRDDEIEIQVQPQKSEETLGFLCAIKGKGENNLENSAQLISDYLTEWTPFKCWPVKLEAHDGGQ